MSDVIAERLTAFGVDLNYLRGQGYDGASSMSGRFNGVQAFITQVYPQLSTCIVVHIACTWLFQMPVVCRQLETV